MANKRKKSTQKGASKKRKTTTTKEIVLQEKNSKTITTRESVLQEKNSNSAPTKDPKCDKSVKIELTPLTASLIASTKLKVPQVHLERLKMLNQISKSNSLPLDVQNMDKENFASCFGLLIKKEERGDDSEDFEPSEEPEPAKDSQNSQNTWNKTKIKRATQLTSLFRNNPLPITSVNGQRMITRSGFGRCPNPEKMAFNIDKLCSSKKTRTKGPPIKFPIITKKKNFIKEGTYVHDYLFNKKHKYIRKTELVLGMSQKSWTKFNKVKPCVVKLERLSDEDMAQMLQEGLTLKQVQFKRQNRLFKAVYRKMANKQVDLVVPGTSRDLKMENIIKRAMNVKVVLKKMTNREIRKYFKALKENATQSTTKTSKVKTLKTKSKTKAKATKKSPRKGNPYPFSDFFH